MDQSLEIVVIVATAFLVFVLSTTDLGIDLLGIDRGALPQWLQNLASSMTSGREAEGEARIGTLRRIFDAVVIILAVASPLLIFARAGVEPVSLSWAAILELANVSWVAWLLRRPRRRQPGAARVASAEGRPQGRHGSKSKRRRR